MKVKTNGAQNKDTLIERVRKEKFEFFPGNDIEYCKVSEIGWN